MFGVMPAQISPDGRWWWDGTRWRSRTVDGELDMFWFTTTPDWASRVLVMGLIGLIPIVGAINVYGWTLAATDMIRQGWRELPPANFSHLERGVAPFLAGLVYGVVIAFVVGGLAVAAIAIGLSGSSQVPIAVGIGLADGLLLIAVWLFGLYMFAALLIGSDRLGIGQALNPLWLFGLARANHAMSLRVALTYFVAAFVLGIAATVVGLVIPFAGLAVNLALPAIYALLVPALARFEVSRPPA